MYTTSVGGHNLTNAHLNISELDTSPTQLLDQSCNTRDRSSFRLDYGRSWRRRRGCHPEIVCRPRPCTGEREESVHPSADRRGQTSCTLVFPRSPCPQVCFDNLVQKADMLFRFIIYNNEYRNIGIMNNYIVIRITIGHVADLLNEDDSGDLQFKIPHGGRIPNKFTV